MALLGWVQGSRVSLSTSSVTVWRRNVPDLPGTCVGEASNYHYLGLEKKIFISLTDVKCF